MSVVKILRSSQKLPALTAAGSFCLLLALAFLSSPVRSVSLAIVFFTALAVFLISAGHWLLGLRGQPSNRAKQQVTVVSILIVLVIMFRSANSLSWADFTVLVITTIAFLFYVRRR